MYLHCCVYLNIFWNFSRTIDESIPWLLANGKYKEAERIFQKAARVSGVLVPRDVFVTSQENMKLKGKEEKNIVGEGVEESDPVYQIWDIFRYRKIGIYTVILWFIW